MKDFSNVYYPPYAHQLNMFGMSDFEKWDFNNQFGGGLDTAEAQKNYSTQIDSVHIDENMIKEMNTDRVNCRIIGDERIGNEGFQIYSSDLQNNHAFKGLEENISSNGHFNNPYFQGNGQTLLNMKNFFDFNYPKPGDFNQQLNRNESNFHLFNTNETNNINPTNIPIQNIPESESYKGPIYYNNSLQNPYSMYLLRKEERRKKIERYKQKKRNWSKKISYDCRKRVAEKRLRVEGRFISREESEKIKNLLKNGKESFNEKNNLNLDNLKAIISLIRQKEATRTKKRISNKNLISVYSDILKKCSEYYVPLLCQLEQKIGKDEPILNYYNVHDPLQWVNEKEDSSTEKKFFDGIQDLIQMSSDHKSESKNEEESKEKEEDLIKFNEKSEMIYDFYN